MRKKIRIFVAAYLQICAVSSSVVFNAKGSYIGITLASFFIAVLWLENIKMVSVSCRIEKAAYIVGSLCGAHTGHFISNFLLNHEVLGRLF